ncbi:MAG TPA: 16S rRNA (cytosine(1402)-N(4))-methyltransferase RsmH [Candidatus Saccharimonadales bacterium]|nr:16S rRNA (cytosine(1402)-N(4))-methyltransferase RsmH [Candidatus Saccharimonadales bacterium]
MKPTHQPVLLAETVRLLDPKLGEAYFDGTAGYGGHAAAITQRLGDGGRVVLVDRDRAATKALQQRFGQRAEIIRSNYLEAASQLAEDGSLFDIVLLDLGVSSPQLDTPDRGFSFNATAPLDMRMDQTQALTAAEVVNDYSKQRLAELIHRYGQEPRARHIAEAIVTHRPVETTTQLANIIRRVAGPRHHTDTATRTFQAIRIEVNAELAALESALPQLARLLPPGGRLAVISFHSLEDRIVKNFMAREAKDCVCPPKQPICTCGHRASLAKLTAQAVKGPDLDSNNPRARSARLRAAVKINKKQKEVTT